MKEFLNTYADVLQSNHEQVGQVHIDFKRQCLDMTVDKLLEQFVQSKYTGFERPGNAQRRFTNDNLANVRALINDDDVNNTPGVIEYEEVMTSLAEMASQAQIDGANETTTAKEPTTKGTNGETGVAGNKQNTKKSQNAKGMGGLHGNLGRDKDNEKDKEIRIKEKDRDATTKGSRRTTSLLNLFMSNSQGRSTK